MPQARSKKQRNDKYYTCSDHISICVEALNRFFSKHVAIYDPCAGDGRWEQYFKDFGFKNILLSDIEPDNDRVLQQDFLQASPHDLPHTIFVTNPPFSLLPRIFNKCADFDPEAICLLVPRSFAHKLSIRRKLSTKYVLLEEIDLPALNFENVDGTTYTNKESRLLTCFQIWVRGKRTDPVVPTEIPYSLYNTNTKHKVIDNQGVVHTYEVPVEDIGAAFTITTHGSKAGTVKDFQPGVQKANVNAFVIVQDGIDQQELRSKFENTDFSYFTKAYSTVPCISTEEIICCVEGVDYKL